MRPEDVVVGPAVWRDLLAAGARHAPNSMEYGERLYVSLGIEVANRAEGSWRQINLICLATKGELDGITASRGFWEARGLDLGSVFVECSVEPTGVIVLEELILAPTTAVATVTNDVAQRFSSSGQVLHLPGLVHVPTAAGAESYKVLSCQPVSQGIVTEKTIVIMANYNGVEEARVRVRVRGVQPTSSQMPDELQMIASLLESPLGWGGGFGPAGLTYGLDLSRPGYRGVNGAAEEVGGRAFEARCFNGPLDPRLCDYDEDSTIFCKLMDLPRVGVFDGAEVPLLRSALLCNALAKGPRLRSDAQEKKILGVSVDGTFYVDPDSTRIVQNTTVRSRVVPGLQRVTRRDTFPVCPAAEPLDPPFAHVSRLVSSFVHPISAGLDISCTVLIHGHPGSGKCTLVYSVADFLGLHVCDLNALDIVGDSLAKISSNLQSHFQKASNMAPSICLIRNVDALCNKDGSAKDDAGLLSVLTECVAAMKADRGENPVIFVALTHEMDSLSKGFQKLFRYDVKCEAPSEAMRLKILSSITSDFALAPDINLADMASHTAGFTPRDLTTVTTYAVHSAIEGVLCKSSISYTEDDIIRAGLLVTSKDVEKAMSVVRASQSETLGAPKIPNVTWEDVGGLAHVKEAIVDTIQLPLEHPELFASGVKKRSGILFYGPPGTGKTLVAKAVASTFSLNFLSVKGPELLNMYIGESEANVRRLFQRARDARPCVIFFDELDSVAPKRGEKGDSGGVMDRIVSQLLAELDSVTGGTDGGLFVIGATNRPDLLDQALLRPGRFDKLLYLGVSDDHEKQLHILKSLTRKFRLSPTLDLASVAKACPLNLTGADLYALCSDAMLKAIVRTIEAVDARIEEANQSGKHAFEITPPYYLEAMATDEEKTVLVEDVDFMKALGELTPSVSLKDLEHYARVQEKFK
ncbi:peroxisomal assembly protein [Irineochytrium annulatum]|nr:peroxisomal assembly protein [Irineochytrium annulatum]